MEIMNTKTVTINEKEYAVYADIEDAEDYNNAIVGSKWFELEEDTQAKFLVMATRKIDSYNYAGQKVDVNQPLKFPRIMSNGSFIDMDILVNLCCEIASFYNDNGGYNNNSSNSNNDVLNNLKDYKLGDLQVSFKDDAKIEISGLDDIISKALSDWLKSNSMEILL